MFYEPILHSESRVQPQPWPSPPAQPQGQGTGATAQGGAQRRPRCATASGGAVGPHARAHTRDACMWRPPPAPQRRRSLQGLDQERGQARTVFYSIDGFSLVLGPEAGAFHNHKLVHEPTLNFDAQLSQHGYNTTTSLSIDSSL